MLVRSRAAATPSSTLPTAQGRTARLPRPVGDLKVTLDRHAEWKQIFNESLAADARLLLRARTCTASTGRRCRQKYEPLVPYVNHRADLTYVIGEMIGELNVGHAYVGGGDLPQPRRGSRWACSAPSSSATPQTKFFQITKIFKGQNWDPALRSPLTEIGVDVKEGDYIVAVDGQLHGRADRHLRGAGRHGRQAGHAEASTARRRRRAPATSSSSRSADERGLYYYDWVQDNIEKVDEGDRRQGRLHPRARHGRARPERVREVLLPADRQGGADHRRPRQRRRQRLADDHRAAAPRAGAGRHRPQRHAADQSRAR